MTEVLGVLAGGAAGSAVRHLVSEWSSRRALQRGRDHGALPWGTFLVNVAGSFVLGFVLATMGSRSLTALTVGTGFCGGLTTFSTFGLETRNLVLRREGGRALRYVALSLAMGVGVAAIGWSLGQRVR